MTFSGIIFSIQSDTEGNFKWNAKASETESKDLAQMELLKIDLVVHDMITHNEKLFEILNNSSINRHRNSFQYSNNSIEISPVSTPTISRHNSVQKNENDKNGDDEEINFAEVLLDSEISSSLDEERKTSISSQNRQNDEVQNYDRSPLNQLVPSSSELINSREEDQKIGNAVLSKVKFFEKEIESALIVKTSVPKPIVENDSSNIVRVNSVLLAKERNKRSKMILEPEKLVGEVKEGKYPNSTNKKSTTLKKMHSKFKSKDESSAMANDKNPNLEYSSLDPEKIDSEKIGPTSREDKPLNLNAPNLKNEEKKLTIECNISTDRQLSNDTSTNDSAINISKQNIYNKGTNIESEFGIITSTKTASPDMTDPPKNIQININRAGTKEFAEQIHHIKSLSNTSALSFENLLEFQRIIDEALETRNREPIKEAKLTKIDQESTDPQYFFPLPEDSNDKSTENYSDYSIPEKKEDDPKMQVESVNRTKNPNAICAKNLSTFVQEFDTTAATSKNQDIYNLELIKQSELKEQSTHQARLISSISPEPIQHIKSISNLSAISYDNMLELQRIMEVPYEKLLELQKIIDEEFETRKKNNYRSSPLTALDSFSPTENTFPQEPLPRGLGLRNKNNRHGINGTMSKEEMLALKMMFQKSQSDIRADSNSLMGEYLLETSNDSSKIYNEASPNQESFKPNKSTKASIDNNLNGDGYSKTKSLGRKIGGFLRSKFTPDMSEPKKRNSIEGSLGIEETKSPITSKERADFTQNGGSEEYQMKSRKNKTVERSKSFKTESSLDEVQMNQLKKTNSSDYIIDEKGYMEKSASRSLEEILENSGFKDNELKVETNIAIFDSTKMKIPQLPLKLNPKIFTATSKRQVQAIRNDDPLGNPPPLPSPHTKPTSPTVKTAYNDSPLEKAPPLPSPLTKPKQLGSQPSFKENDQQ